MFSQFDFSVRQMAVKMQNMFLFPNEVIKNQVDMVFKQRVMGLEDENKILSSQVERVGKELEKERENGKLLQQLLVDSKTYINMIDNSIKLVHSSLIKTLKENLQLFDLMKGDNSQFNELQDTALDKETEVWDYSDDDF